MNQRAPRPPHTVLLALIGLVVGSCGTPTLPEPDAVDLAARRIDRSLSRSLDATGDPGRFIARLRHNPAPCECPPWEIAVGSRWQRIAIVVDRNAAEDVVDWFETPAGVLETAVEIDRDEVPSETDWVYRVVRVVGGQLDEPVAQ